MIITISRQFGAGGALVARMLADRLGWSLVDNELIDEVATRAGIAPEEVAEHDERAPGFIERLTRALASSMPEFVAPESGTLPDLAEERLVKITERVVSEAAEQGKVVLVGRAALAVLASHPRTLHHKIVAPLANRIARVVERQGVDMKQAEKLIHDADSNRARYHKQYYQRDWADPTNYDLVINTARIGIEGAVEVIVDRLKRIGDGY
jgi:cytidylate kinase